MSTEAAKQGETPPKPPETLPPATVPFPLADLLLPCTLASCHAAHTWQPTLAIAKCPGCQGPILALQMRQCPVCNEPVSKLTLRMDHLPTGGVITPMCRGSASLAENLQIEVTFGHAEAEAAAYIPKEVVSKL